VGWQPCSSFAAERRTTGCSSSQVSRKPSASSALGLVDSGSGSPRSSVPGSSRPCGQWSWPPFSWSSSRSARRRHGPCGRSPRRTCLRRPCSRRHLRPARGAESE